MGNAQASIELLFRQQWSNAMILIKFNENFAWYRNIRYIVKNEGNMKIKTLPKNWNYNYVFKGNILTFH